MSGQKGKWRVPLRLLGEGEVVEALDTIEVHFPALAGG